MALTDLSVRAAKAGPTVQKLSDGRGLQLHITPTGSKLWRWAYRYDGKQKLMALGIYPDISLAQARQAADAARKLLAVDVDPMAQRKVDKINRQQAADNTFKAVVIGERAAQAAGGRAVASHRGLEPPGLCRGRQPCWWTWLTPRVPVALYRRPC